MSSEAEKLTRDEWDERWLFVYNQLWLETKQHQRSFDLAHKHMQKRYGPRPDGPLGQPGLLDLIKLGWQLRSLKMNKNGLIGAALAFIGGAVAALSLVATDGISSGELLSALGAGVAAVLAYLKQSPLATPPAQ